MMYGSKKRELTPEEIELLTMIAQRSDAIDTGVKPHPSESTFDDIIQGGEAMRESKLISQPSPRNAYKVGYGDVYPAGVDKLRGLHDDVVRGTSALNLYSQLSKALIGEELLTHAMDVRNNKRLERGILNRIKELEGHNVGEMQHNIWKRLLDQMKLLGQ